MNGTNNCFPPQPGSTIGFICTKCGKRFSAKPGTDILSFINRNPHPKCPACGSHKTMRDPMIEY